MQPTPVAGTRYHSLDAVRAFALLLGVVFHAAESFGHSAIYYWAIGDNSPSVTLELFQHACHSFRLELFLLIAGFFAHLLWQRRGMWGFVRNRAARRKPDGHSEFNLNSEVKKQNQSQRV
jgi:peptidoglycan/LPS O-acetylase OafA/YrhL